MIRYTTFDAVIARVANEVKKNTQLTDIRAWIFEGLREVGGPYKSKPQEYELLIDNHRGYLPSDIIWIDDARYIMVDQKTEAEDSTADTGKEPNESPLKGYPRVRYIGEMPYSNAHCDDCDYTYSIYQDCSVYTSFDSGYLVLTARVRNDRIPDIPELRTFLTRWVEYEYARNRMFAGDQGAMSLYDRVSADINSQFSRAYAALLEYNLNERVMDEHNQGPVSKWLNTDVTQRRLRNGRRSR